MNTLGFISNGHAAGSPVKAHFDKLPGAAPSAARYAVLQDSFETGASSGTATFVAVAAAVISILWTSRRRGSRDNVAMGSCLRRGGKGVWFQPVFRAKPGDKYKYRTHRDLFIPEFGLFPIQEKGRIMKYGMIVTKGKPWEAKDIDDNDHRGGINNGRRKVDGALLLDCDGTLVETERDGHRVSFNEAFKQNGFNVEWDVNLYGELLTTGGGKERMARYFTDYNPGAWTSEDPPSPDHPTIKELHKLKTSLFMEIIRRGELPLRPGIRELIAAAAKAGWTLAVCSTSNEDSVRAVVETMLPEFAGQMEIFAGDVVKEKKPDPAIYKLASKSLGIAPMKCVVVEDTEIGAKAGKAAGMSVIVTKSIYSQNEDFSDADLVVDSAEDLTWDEVKALLPVFELA